MKEEVKDLWLEALRSGKFRQGRRRLKVMLPDGRFEYCCLGVLCEIAKPYLLDMWEKEEKEDVHFIRFYGVFSGTLSPQVMDWAGMENDLGTRKGGPLLAYLNDGGWSFEEIARVIELEWEDL